MTEKTEAIQWKSSKRFATRNYVLKQPQVRVKKSSTECTHGVADMLTTQHSELKNYQLHETILPYKCLDVQYFLKI